MWHPASDQTLRLVKRQDRPEVSNRRSEALLHAFGQQRLLGVVEEGQYAHFLGLPREVVRNHIVLVCSGEEAQSSELV